MKKIYLILAITIFAISAKAQSNQKTDVTILPSSAVNNTVKEDPHNPLVNGIPYNQYKVQVQGEQKETAAKDAAAKSKQKELLNKQSKVNLPPNPNRAEKPKK